MYENPPFLSVLHCKRSMTIRLYHVFKHYYIWIPVPGTMMTYNLVSMKIQNRKGKNCAMWRFPLNLPSAYVLHHSDLDTSYLRSKYSLKTKALSAAVENWCLVSNKQKVLSDLTFSTVSNILCRTVHGRKYYF